MQNDIVPPPKKPAAPSTQPAIPIANPQPSQANPETKPEDSQTAARNRPSTPSPQPPVAKQKSAKNLITIFLAVLIFLALSGLAVYVEQSEQEFEEAEQSGASFEL